MWTVERFAFLPFRVFAHGLESQRLEIPVRPRRPFRATRIVWNGVGMPSLVDVIAGDGVTMNAGQQHAFLQFARADRKWERLPLGDLLVEPPAGLVLVFYGKLVSGRIEGFELGD